MDSFCTLFDKNYLVFGLALHQSLQRIASPYHLYMLAMDEVCERTLRKLALEHVTVLGLTDIIGPERSFVYQQMSFGQICWTCQPFLCRYLLEHCGLDSVTYLEADSYFFSDPRILLDEIGGRSVSLVPHNYAPGYDHTDMSGIYCVEFNLFRNDTSGRELLSDWEQACLRYDRTRPRYFPGQICLDSWPSRSAAVHVVTHKGAGVAPWNEALFDVGSASGRPTVDGVPVVFYHFHELSFMDRDRFFLSSYALDPSTIQHIYQPYLRELRRLRNWLQMVIPGFDYCKRFRPQGFWETLSSPRVDRVRRYVRYLYSYYRGRRNIVRLEPAP